MLTLTLTARGNSHTVSYDPNSQYGATQEAFAAAILATTGIGNAWLDYHTYESNSESGESTICCASSDGGVLLCGPAHYEIEEAGND
jgi:hypothetical protein